MRSGFTAAGLAALALVSVCAPGTARAQTQIAQTGQTVTTAGEGKQVLFPDKTSISVGANSKVAVRRVDYDKQTGSANVVIEVAKGAVRYVTGNTEGSHTIKTPLSTVGVRGTVIEGYVDSNGNEIFALMEGAFEACTALGCMQVTVPGTFVIVNAAGVISAPTPIPPSMMSALLLVSPSLDLLHEYFSDRINNGKDPLVVFRDLNDARLNSAVQQPGRLPGCRRDYDCDGDIDDPKHPHGE